MSLRPASARPALTGPIRWASAPKPGGGTRTLARLSADDDLRFAGAVARVVPFVERARGREAVANRAEHPDTRRGPIALEPWPRARARWGRELGRIERTARVVAVTDVRECYASIVPKVVQDRLASLGAPPEIATDVGSWLRVFRDAGVAGLPVGPEASAVLADAVLLAGDAALRVEGIAHLRWVDDVIIASAGSTECPAGLGSAPRGVGGCRTRGSRWQDPAPGPGRLRGPSWPIELARERSLTAIIATREDPLPRRPGVHPLVPGDRRVDPDRRAAHPASGERGAAGGGPRRGSCRAQPSCRASSTPTCISPRPGWRSGTARPRRQPRPRRYSSWRGLVPRRARDRSYCEGSTRRGGTTPGIRGWRSWTP